MLSIKKLKQLTERLPDDAEVIPAECGGLVSGLAIYFNGKDGWIDCENDSDTDLSNFDE